MYSNWEGKLFLRDLKKNCLLKNKTKTTKITRKIKQTFMACPPWTIFYFCHYLDLEGERDRKGKKSKKNMKKSFLGFCTLSSRSLLVCPLVPKANVQSPWVNQWINFLFISSLYLVQEAPKFTVMRRVNLGHWWASFRVLILKWSPFLQSFRQATGM